MSIHSPRQGQEALRNKEGADLFEFDARFLRCYHLQHFIACRLLGGPEQAEKAVENCWYAASRNPPRFEYEGAFRRWLLRVLINEALALLHETWSAEAVGRNEMRESDTKVLTGDTPPSVAEIPIHFPKEALKQRTVPETNWKDTMKKIESNLENKRASNPAISATRYLDADSRQKESGSAFKVAVFAAVSIWGILLFILLNGI